MFFVSLCSQSAGIHWLPDVSALCHFGLQTFRPFSALGRFGIGRFARRFGPDSALDKLRFILTMYITFYLILSLFDCWRFCIQGICYQEISYPIYEFSGEFKSWVRIIQSSRHTYNFYFNKSHTMCKLYRSLFPYLMFSAIEINLRFVCMYMYILK